jgi:hypothetical protein
VPCRGVPCRGVPCRGVPKLQRSALQRRQGPRPSYFASYEGAYIPSIGEPCGPAIPDRTTYTCLQKQSPASGSVWGGFGLDLGKVWGRCGCVSVCLRVCVSARLCVCVSESLCVCVSVPLCGCILCLYVPVPLYFYMNRFATGEPQ